MFKKFLATSVVGLVATAAGAGTLNAGNDAGGTFSFPTLVSITGPADIAGSFSFGVTGALTDPEDVGIKLKDLLGNTFSASTFADNGASYTFSFKNVASGDYSLLVLGDNGVSGKTKFLGGTYTVSAVPEPETYALMLAGLGVVGFIGRRRSGRGAAA